ncbi:MAG: hypothetical protein WC284_12730 [Candidimonas sp.]
MTQIINLNEHTYRSFLDDNKIKSIIHNDLLMSYGMGLVPTGVFAETMMVRAINISRHETLTAIHTGASQNIEDFIVISKDGKYAYNMKCRKLSMTTSRGNKPRVAINIDGKIGYVDAEFKTIAFRGTKITKSTINDIDDAKNILNALVEESNSQLRSMEEKYGNVRNIMMGYVFYDDDKMKSSDNPTHYLHLFHDYQPSLMDTADTEVVISKKENKISSISLINNNGKKIISANVGGDNQITQAYNMVTEGHMVYHTVIAKSEADDFYEKALQKTLNRITFDDCVVKCDSDDKLITESTIFDYNDNKIAVYAK